MGETSYDNIKTCVDATCVFGDDQVGFILIVGFGSLLHSLTETFCCIVNYLGRDQNAAERRFTA